MCGCTGMSKRIHCISSDHLFFRVMKHETKKQFFPPQTDKFNEVCTFLHKLTSTSPQDVIKLAKSRICYIPTDTKKNRVSSNSFEQNYDTAKSTNIPHKNWMRNDDCAFDKLLIVTPLNAVCITTSG